jgi:Na+-driven multidrug efflux pump
VATRLVTAGVVFVLGGSIVQLFDSGSVDLAIDFIKVFAFNVAGFSIDRVMRGGLRGAGDIQ